MLKNLFRLASDKLFVISESQNEVLDLESPESICIPRFSDPPYTYRGHLNQKREIMFCNTGNCYTLEDGENWTQTTFKESRSQFTIGKTGRGQSMIVGGIGGMSGPYFVNSVEILTDGQWTTFEKDLPHCVLYTCLVTPEGFTMPLFVGGHCYTENAAVLFFNEETKAWETHSTLNTPTTKHTCGLIPAKLGSDQKSVIVAGGTGNVVEILDPGMNQWRYGPELPFKGPLLDAAMVEDPKGGVIVVGGSLDVGGVGPIDKLIRLPHAGPGAEWEVLPIALKSPISSHIAMILPYHLVNCTGNV